MTCPRPLDRPVPSDPTDDSGIPPLEESRG